MIKFKPESFGKKQEEKIKEESLESKEAFTEATKELSAFSENISGLKKNIRKLTMILGISIASLGSVAAQAQEAAQQAQEPEETEYSIEDVDKITQEIESNLETNNWDEIIRLAEAAGKVDTVFNNKYMDTYFAATIDFLIQRFGDKFEEYINVDNAKTRIKIAISRHDWKAVEGWAKIAKEEDQSKE